MSPKRINRQTRKRVLLRRAWAKREADARAADAGAWWHLFGGEAPDMATDADGVTGPAWACWVLGPSAFGPDDPPPPIEGNDGATIRESAIDGPNGSRLTHRGSWRHVPSVAEVDEVTPEQYRASEGARTEPINVGPPDA